MIADVIYSNPLPIGKIIASVIGLLIGVGFLIGTILQMKHKTIKTTLSVIFIILAIVIMCVGIFSLIQTINN